MAKRELSSTLKNLKFMQRAVKKEEKPKVEEEVQPNGNFVSPTTENKKCIVIMEGNPHPGAIKGRMSFQSFNPSIDKLNEEAANPCQPKISATSNGDRKTSKRENGSSSLGLEGSSVAPGSDSDGDHKRKQLEEFIEIPPYPHKSSKNKNGSRKHQNRDKLDWNLLRPPKVQQ